MSIAAEMQEVVDAVKKEGSPKSVVVLREQAGAVSNRYRTVSICNPNRCCCAIVYRGWGISIAIRLKGSFSL